MAFVDVSQLVAILAVIYAIVLPLVHGQSPGPAPAASNDGASIDQGIACLLMLVALILTYLIH